MPREFIQVDPHALFLPPTRKGGSDPVKLQRQIAKHGSSLVGMPALLVTRDGHGNLQIIDGVTRATRAAKLAPGQTVIVEVTVEEPSRDYRVYPTVGDRLP